MKDLTHKKPSDSSLLLTKEEHRKNSFISSLLFSRATIFHPSSRLTNDMKNRLVEVASHGGTDPNRPLESVTMNSYGKNFRVDLHVDYLLQSHRDILEAILAFANSIVLDEESYVKGKRLTWSNIFSTITDGIPSSDQPSNEFDSIIDRDSTVLSISFYELATRMGISPTRKNYDNIEQRIIQLTTAHLIVNELNEDGIIVDRKPLRFLSDYRFFCDKSKFKNNNNKHNNLTNHVFVIPDMRLLMSIRDHGYFYRLEQFKMSHYSKPSVRSFLKYLITHEPKYLNKKKLDWAIDLYVKSIASGVNHNFKNDLKKEILRNKEQIESDFGLQVIDNGSFIQIIAIGDDV